jgi:hypothetical protein
MDMPMNKKLFVGAAALTTVVVAGYVYYRWVGTKLETFVEDDLDLNGNPLDRLDRLDEELEKESAQRQRPPQGL